MSDIPYRRASSEDSVEMLEGKTSLEKILIGAAASLGILSFSLIIALAVVASQHGSSNPNEPYSNPARPNDQSQISEIRSLIFDGLQRNKIKSNLRALTKNVHVAGTAEQLGVMQWLHDAYVSTGLDKVEFADYKVALNYPVYDNPNTISLVRNGVVSTPPLSSGLSDVLGDAAAQAEQNADQRARNLWLAYAGDGTVTAPVVYVNYGRLEDFADVAKAGVNVSGRICMMRYGRLFRGDKVKEAGKHGCFGAILYSDYAEAGPAPGKSSVWPQSVWLPPSGGQRGSTMVFDGDIQTPAFPAKNYTFRSQSIKQAQDSFFIPKIPATPIGYADATKIFNAMDGIATLPKGFQGANPGASYKLTSTSAVQLRLAVHSRMNTSAHIRNVIGRMYGSEEPDSWVILINHVDAWTFGSIDPNGGTCIITEVARAFMDAHRATGWRPRRSLMFVSVDAEEYGLIGSTEWVEEMVKVLQVRAVALVNVDVAIHGFTSFDASTVPMMYRTLVRASKLVANPNKAEVSLGRPKIYDSWIYWRNPANTTDLFLPKQTEVPYMSIPSSGSDHSGFQNYVGIPCGYISFRCYPRACYPLYHSMYEIDWTMEHLFDPAFDYSKAVGDVWAEVVRDISDSLIIPFNVSDYAAILQVYTADIHANLKKDFATLIPNFSTVLGNLEGSASRFATAAANIQGYVDSANSGSLALSVSQAQMINGRLASLERAFVTPSGLPGRFNFRHVVFATSIHNNYEGVAFAGIADAATSYLESTASNKTALLHTLRLTINQVQFAIESAILVLDMSGYPV